MVGNKEKDGIFDMKTKQEQPDFIKDLWRIMNRVKVIGNREGKFLGFCIGNTAKKIDADFFFTPIRNTSCCVCGSVVIDRMSFAEILFQELDGQVDYFFVDTEKKISPELYTDHDVGNVERTARKMAQRTKVLTYKGNDLTVDTVDVFLAQICDWDERGLGGKKIAIIGLGNIGFKLALKLMERGGEVHVVRRHAAKLRTMVDALNMAKPRGTIAKVCGSTNITDAMKDADVVIGLTPGTHDIQPEMIATLKSKSILIDAGKGSFSPEAVRAAENRGLVVWRSNIQAAFEAQITLLLKTEAAIKQSYGRGIIEGIPIVSGGIVGAAGEIVVDNVHAVTEIYGVADGAGDFKRELSAEEKAILERLNSILLHSNKNTELKEQS